MAKNLQRKRGRPLSGKKAFCIRLTPKARTKLCRMANEHNLELSAWLESLAAVNMPLSIDLEGEYDAEEAGRRFEFLLREAHRLVAELNEMFDLNPSLAKTDSVKPSLQEFYKVAKGLCDFMASEGVVTLDQ